MVRMGVGRKAGRAVTVAALLLLASCASVPPPKQADDLCAIFGDRANWYDATRKAEANWGTSVPMQMAVMYHESSYVDDAQPPRRYLLGFIPWTRPSSAFGYAQAKDETWDWYIDKTGNRGADRDDFADAADFVAWYLAQSRRMLKLAPDDAYNHYLAYHEGHAGYRAKSYEAKPWLMRYARKVEATAKRYAAQLKGCGGRLETTRR